MCKKTINQNEVVTCGYARPSCIVVPLTMGSYVCATSVLLSTNEDFEEQEFEF